MKPRDENDRLRDGTLPADPATGTRPALGVTGMCTDLANAERVVKWYGADLRFSGAWRKWIAWDERRWSLDQTGAAERCAAATSRAMVADAGVMINAATERLSRSPDDPNAAKALQVAKAFLTWSLKSQSSPRLAAMLEVARSFEAIAIAHEQLDADAFLLNVSNGTIDLRTGELRAHRREDLITKLAPVAFDPNATAPTWQAFLARAMGGDVELVGYLQRVFGYALTGDVREHILVFNFGAGANGKSTALGALHAMLGDYACPAPRGMLFRARGERHPTELATLHGRRFVTCSEIEEGHAFDEALVKDLTGGDPIPCRRMNEDFWSFTPSHKLLLAGNHKPAVRGDDEGIWRRMRLIPWTVTIPEAERDKSLPEKLRAELPGILAWCVRGCLEWQRRGLDEPEAVRAATRSYRDESDALGEFFRLHVAFEADATIARKVLREAYEGFAKENGAEPLGARRFAGRLRERGVREANVREGARVLNGWRGVRLATEAERERRYEGTCSDRVPPPRSARVHEEANRNSAPTTANVPTGDEQEDFKTWLEGQEVERGQA